MEGRWLLYAVDVDLSGDPGPDTVTMVAYGADTYIDANGVQVRPADPSVDISSLTITGTNQNDTFSFDYRGGNPVPNGTISVNGNGGAGNELEVTANANFTLASYVQLYGNMSGMITYSNIQQALANNAGGSSNVVNLGAGSSAAGLFYGHLAIGPGEIPGANFQAQYGGYNNVAFGFDQVYAASSNASDIAYLDDYYAGINNAVAHPTVAWFGSTSLEDVVSKFTQVNFSAGDLQDYAFLDDQYSTAAATASYTPMDAKYSGSGYSYEASNFGVSVMTGDNESDVATLKDAPNAPGSFYSTPTYTNMGGYDNGESYLGSAYFHTVSIVPLLYSEHVEWHDNAGAAAVDITLPTEQYIIYFANGSTVTDTSWSSATSRIYAYNDSNPAIKDYLYINTPPFNIVTVSPNDATHWQIGA